MTAQDTPLKAETSSVETPREAPVSSGTKPSGARTARQEKNKAAQWAAKSLLSLFVLSLLVLGVYGVALKNAWLAPPAWWATWSVSLQETPEDSDSAERAAQQVSLQALAKLNEQQAERVQTLVDLIQAQSNRLDDLADQLAVSKTAELRLRQQLSLMQEDLAVLKAGKKAVIPADVALALSRLVSLSQSRMEQAMAGTTEMQVGYAQNIQAKKDDFKEGYSLEKVTEGLLSLVRVRDNAMQPSDYTAWVDWQFWFVLRVQIEGLQALLVNPELSADFLTQQLKSIQAQIDTHPLRETREELSGLLAVVSQGLRS